MFARITHNYLPPLQGVKKLQVDKAPHEPDGTSLLLESHSAVLLRRVALTSGENAPDEHVLEVLNDVTKWLSSQSNDLSSVSRIVVVSELGTVHVLSRPLSAYLYWSIVTQGCMPCTAAASHYISLCAEPYADRHHYGRRTGHCKRQFVPLTDTELPNKHSLPNEQNIRN